MYLQNSFICVRILHFLHQIFSVFYTFYAPFFLRILVKIFPGRMLLHWNIVIFKNEYIRLFVILVTNIRIFEYSNIRYQNNEYCQAKF